MIKIKRFKLFNSELFTLCLSFGFFLLLLLGSINEYLLQLDSLKKISGTVSYVEHKSFEHRPNKGPTSKYKSMIMRLKGNQSSYEVNGLPFETGTIERIKKGDTIDLYTRHWYQSPFSFNNTREIYHLKKGQSVLLNINSLRSGNLTALICSGLILIVLSWVILKLRSSDGHYGW